VKGFLASPCFPIAVLLAIGPAMAVVQFRAMAPAVTAAFVFAVAAGWRQGRRVPWPRLTPLLGIAAALLAWALVSAAWSVEPARAATTTLSLGGLLLLAAMAAQAVGEDTARNRRRIGTALVGGLAIGVVVLGFDHLSWNLVRRAARGFPDWVPSLGFGAKPAVSVLGLLLPLVVAVPGVPPLAKGAVVLGAVGVALWLPAESAKIALLAGVAGAGVAAVLPRVARHAGAGALAVVFLAAPLVFALVLARVTDASALPPSASHRVMIWDFAVSRIAERPVAGWGMEASRAIPGGTDTFPRETLDRFGLTSEFLLGVFASPNAQRLPLHPHNAALQVWLELGAVGAVIAAALAAAVLLGAPSAGAFGAAVAGAVTGQLSFGVWQPWWIASLLLAAVVAGAIGRGR